MYMEMYRDASHKVIVPHLVRKFQLIDARCLSLPRIRYDVSWIE